MRKKVYDVSIVGSAGIPASYGGFETLAQVLADTMSTEWSVAVACSKDNPGSHAGFSPKRSRMYVFPWAANGWQSVPYDVHALLSLARKSKSTLILGVSGCICLPLIRILARRTKIVVNIDGIEWRRAKWGRVARLFLRFSEWMAVRFSDVVIADNIEIKKYIREAYGIEAQFIPYGAYSPVLEKISLGWGAGEEYYLGLCRIEPENNVDLILEAFRLVQVPKITFIGNWDKSVYGRSLRDRYGRIENIRLLDPIYDPRELAKLRLGARAYIHGHSAGGTNPSLVEAMIAGVAPVCFDVAYNRETTGGGAFYWDGISSLVDIISGEESVEFSECGKAMREFALQHYDWTTIVASYRGALQVG